MTLFTWALLKLGQNQFHTFEVWTVNLQAGSNPVHQMIIYNSSTQSSLYFPDHGALLPRIWIGFVHSHQVMCICILGNGTHGLWEQLQHCPKHAGVRGVCACVCVCVCVCVCAYHVMSCDVM